MKKAEIILGITATIAIISKFLNIPKSNMAILISILLLSLIYVIFSFALLNEIRFREIFKKESYQNVSGKKIIGAIAIGVGFSIVLLGILFKLLIWTGGQYMLQTGITFLGVITFVFVIYYLIKKTANLRKTFIRIGIIGGIALITYFTPTDTLIDYYYQDNPEYAELFKKSNADPNNEELNRQLQEKRKEIND
tara:strand:+ start:2487 stop:3068 length:582 start_codon:yes stop_codon:yes gene_type:complete